MVQEEYDVIIDYYALQAINYKFSQEEEVRVVAVSLSLNNTYGICCQTTMQ